MGVYNFHAPQILGQEWVPLRDENLTFAPAVNLVEVGHSFRLNSSKTLTTARFYLAEWPPGDPNAQVVTVNIYPHTLGDRSGPVRSVIIPCINGLVSGGSGSFVNASTFAQAFHNPSDGSYYSVSNNTIDLRLWFGVERYIPELSGKRILGIDLLYSVVEDNGGNVPVAIYAAVGSVFTSVTSGIGFLHGPEDDVFLTEIGRARAGEMDPFWQLIAPNGETLPWTFARLRGFDNTSAAPGRHMRIIITPAAASTQAIHFHYFAMEVFYCEENRIAYGGREFVPAGIASNRVYNLGANIIPLRVVPNVSNPVADAANPVVLPGIYDVVISSGYLGDRQPLTADTTATVAAPYPELNQVRQLYHTEGFEAIKVLHPFPVGPESLGETFTDEDTQLVPQISIHDATGPIPEVHVYGRQAAAQVYGTITATQEIFDGVAGGAAQYPQVRYYARRFGDTSVPLKLDSPTITGSSVEISPVDFDALTEIIDGWKEITLRFATPPSMGSGTNPQWRWSATGELAANRWEVMGAIAPALSGIPGNLINVVPSPHQLSLATYGAAVSGANINLGWVPQYAPAVTATTDDPTSDAVLLFSQDPLIITGFGVTEQDQPLVGIGLDCDLDPCCIPTEIQYHELTWSRPLNSGYAVDDFNRTVAANSWGTATSGQTWTPNSTSNITYSVNGMQGVIAISGAPSIFKFVTLLNAGGPDQQASVDLATPGIPNGQVLVGLVLRATDANNYYAFVASAGVTGQMGMIIYKVVAGTATALLSVNVFTLTARTASTFTIKAAAAGNRLLAKAWAETEAEPDWQLDVTDSTFATGNLAGIYTQDVGPVNPTFLVDNFTLGPPDVFFGAIELQRMDTVTTEWQTIMRATSPSVTAFSDYEARVGILSSYRIRYVNVYDFEGPWSATVSHTLSSPGATIGCLGDGHLMIFTSNDMQDGSINLAYSNAWEAGQTVEENFLFPESRFVQLQAMYNRDFFTAFRPTERGGEQFSRTILVQAAAIDPETLADFTSLRDMAWANTSYICVRDEDGNRWFATVLVPSGRVLRDRRLYLAPVEVIEVTDTPSQVDP